MRCKFFCSDLCLQRFHVSFQQVLCQIHSSSKHTSDAQLSLFAGTAGVQSHVLECVCVPMQDLDLPPEMVAEARTAPGEDSQFVAPTPGVTPTQRWLQKCSLAADHVAAGDFASATRLLNR